MNPHLFVYGTLMPSAASAYGRPMRERLAREARLLGPARTAGRLYDLGRYPGLVAAAEAGETVHGELLLLTDPAAAFQWLDRYEGIVPGAADNEYARVERSVQLAGSPAEPVPAWVYVYRAPLTSARHIPGGRWQG